MLCNEITKILLPELNWKKKTQKQCPTVLLLEIILIASKPQLGAQHYHKHDKLPIQTRIQGVISHIIIKLMKHAIDGGGQNPPI